MIIADYTDAFRGELKMNLLEKYKTLAFTGERENVKKGFIEELPAISVNTSAISAKPFYVVKAKGSNGVDVHFPEMKVVWKNPFTKGNPEARVESLRVVEVARRGELI
jgi:hypothetical protein